MKSILLEIGRKRKQVRELNKEIESLCDNLINQEIIYRGHNALINRITDDFRMVEVIVSEPDGFIWSDYVYIEELQTMIKFKEDLSC